MRIIIAGAGEVGTHLAKMLSYEQHDIVVIDTDEKKLSAIDTSFDLLTINGSAISFSVLGEAKVKNADLFVAATHSEETNLMAAILSKKLGAKKTIARIDSSDYLLPKNRDYFIKLGVDFVICPEKLAASEIVGLLRQTGSSEVFEFSNGKLLLLVIKLDENAPIIDKTLVESSSINKNFDYRAIAITRDSKTIIPRGYDKFQLNDLVFVLTNKDGVENLLKYSGKESFDISNIMILGGSRIGYKTARDLEGHINIKLIESDTELSHNLAEMLEKTLVVNSDISNINTLKDEGLKDMDAFIAVTDNSETNILACLYAKKNGVKKTIAEIENIDYIDLAENIGIDTIINKKLITASNIFRHTMSAKVENLKCLTGANAEVFEFVVQKRAKITKKALKDIDFPKDAIIGGVVRGNDSFIAIGDTIIQDNDRVVVFSLPSAFKKVDKFFN